MIQRKKSNIEKPDFKLWYFFFALMTTLLLVVCIFNMSQPKRLKSHEIAELKKEVSQILVSEFKKQHHKTPLPELKNTTYGVKIILPVISFFSPDSTAFLPESLPVLDSLLTVIKSLEHHIIIVGHTDPSPIESGTYPSHWELAAAQSAKITRYFTKEPNKKQRFASVSMGSQKPLTRKTDATSKNKNHRIEIHILLEKDFEI